MATWLVTIAQLPTEDPAARMRVLRTLESLGAAVMREGAYILPHSAANRQALDALADYIGKSAGSAQVLEVHSASEAQQDSFQRLFDRSARYESLIKTVESLRVGFGHSDPSAISRVLHKQRREFEAIAALDFFPTAARARAEQSLAEVAAAVKKLRFGGPSQAALGAQESLQRRTWATRKPPWADRLACAWLVRRFVDPEATLVWLDKADELPAGALGFASKARISRRTRRASRMKRCSARLDLQKSPALVKIGSIVHFLEMGGEAVPEAAGVQTLLHGAQRRAPRAEEWLTEAEKTFDLLYEAYYDPARKA